MITSLQSILKKAQKGKYAVGAFNTSNLEITLAIIRAAVSLKSPVIISTSESAIRYSNLAVIFEIITTLANTVGKSVPIAIHLDHGKNLQIVKDCIKQGYGSVHIDASERDFGTNIKWTKEIVRLAHAKKIAVQAELGAILGKEGLVKLKSGQINMKDLMTDPVQAQDFVKKTGIDTLAVSVGTIHGSFRGIEKVDQPRLQKIAKLTKLPIVLHGGSGLTPAMFRQAIKNGVRIVNIDTNLRIAFKKALFPKKVEPASPSLGGSDMIDPRQILTPATQAMQKEVAKMIKIFGSSNKA